MDIFDYQLFLGLPISLSYQQELKELPSSLHDLLIQNNNPLYLQEVEVEGIAYLGKYLGFSVEMASLDALKTHIYSLLKRLIPDYPYEQSPLVLLALSSP